VIALALLPPLLLALLLAAGGTRTAARAAPLASLPAVALAWLPAQELELPWLVLGVRLALDASNQPLLLLIGLAFSAAAWFGAASIRRRPAAFWLFWLATLEGLLLVALARDMAGFYFGYALMTVAGYGLVVHEGSAPARRAGRVYLVLALGGEALILTGLLLLGARFGNLDLVGLPALLGDAGAGLAGPCLLLGFAVKMGIVPLHVWLPVAHPVAPVPASAVLSGVIVKAGLIGWLRFLPPEAFAGGAPITGLLVLGLATAFYGVLAGLAQPRLKTVLAYSTVSQMGLVLAAFALTLSGREARDALLPLLGLLMLHHGLQKAALFLAAGSHPGASRGRLALLLVPALSLAGAPLTSGALGKKALEAALGAASLEGFAGPLALTSLATALLMLRAFFLARGDTVRDGPPHPAWPILTLVGVIVPWVFAGLHGQAVRPDLDGLWQALWPLLAALALAALAVRLRRFRPQVAEGDLLALADVLGRQLAPLWRWRPAWPALPEPDLRTVLRAGLSSTERRIGSVPAAGLLLLLITALLWPLLR
jgi:formate hydrogenlyase subunit 3/multisubunit Na+/H+ antiporter MnhD subunit